MKPDHDSFFAHMMALNTGARDPHAPVSAVTERFYLFTVVGWHEGKYYTHTEGQKPRIRVKSGRSEA